MKKLKRLFLFVMATAILLSSFSSMAAGSSSAYTIKTVNGTTTVTNKYGSVSFSSNATNVTWSIGPGYASVSASFPSSSSRSSSYSPPPPPKTVDLTVTDITPLSGRQGLNLVSMVSIKNSGTGSASNVQVEFVADGVTQTRSVTVGAGKTVSVMFVWAAPMKSNASITVTVNKSKAITETNYNNNSLSRSVTLKEGYKTADPNDAPEHEVGIPSTPGGENNRTVSWTENGTNYNANISLSASSDPTGMKSGYGFKVTANTAVTSNYPDSSAIIQPQGVIMLVPEFGFSSAVHLVKEGNSWVLPVNSISPMGEKRWYVPVWWPDGKRYEAVITAYGAFTPGGELIASEKVSIMIDSNMYTDDSTNGMWAH